MTPEMPNSTTPEAEIVRLRRELRLARAEAELLEHGLLRVAGDIERIGGSAVWRWGHRFARMYAGAWNRRPTTQGAVVRARDRIRRLQGSSVAAPPPPLHRAARLSRLLSADAAGAEQIHVAVVGRRSSLRNRVAGIASARDWRVTFADGPEGVSPSVDFLFAIDPSAALPELDAAVVVVAWMDGDGRSWATWPFMHRVDLVLGSPDEESRREVELVTGRPPVGISADVSGDELADLLAEVERQPSFAVRFTAASWEAAHLSGDFHFACSLARELRRRGNRAVLDVLPDHGQAGGATTDAVIVVRGRARHRPLATQLNILWCISHPDELTTTEAEAYDLVCVASAGFAADLAERLSSSVVTLEQATDPALFHPEPASEHASPLVFVGNARGVRRQILDDLLPTEHDLAVYGAGWDGAIDQRYLAARHVPNQELRRVYSSAGLVLNDHWPDMRDRGFISNRVYDAVACGAMVISDAVDGIEEGFDGAVVTYRSPEELREVIAYFLSRPDERAARGAAGRAKVLAHDTFAHRAAVLLEHVEERSARLAYLGTSTAR